MNSSHLSSVRRRTFPTLCLALAGLLMSTAVFASGSGIPCELTLPDGTLWSDYFESSGRSLSVDDECGMVAPLSAPLALAGDTWVSFDVPFTPHQITYEMFLHLEAGKEFTDEVVVLRMGRYERGRFIAVADVRLTTPTDLEVRILTDTDPVVISKVSINPDGSWIALEVTKSLASGQHDGRVRLQVDDQPTREATALSLWHNLPTEVRIGVVEVDTSFATSESPGSLYFQPVGFSHRFFAYTP